LEKNGNPARTSTAEETIARKDAQQALIEKNRLVMLLQSIAVAANQARSAEEAMQICLARICEYTGWPIGHVYLRSSDDPDQLIPSRIWSVDDIQTFRDFEAITEQTTFRRGEGLPGRVLASGGPVWVTDLDTDPHFKRVHHVKNVQLKSGFAFPVWLGDQIVAVLEFFSGDPEAPHRRFWEVLIPIANQLAQVLQRQKSEEQMRAMARKLERSNKELQDFAFVASHDLQEPLRKIQAFTDRLTSTGIAETNEQARDYLERINRAAERMQRLINDLLAFSRVETRGQAFVQTDLGQVVRDVLSDLETRIEQTDASVELGELPSIEADPTQMQQLFLNLIVNAIKFHKEGIPPVVRIEAQPVPPPDGIPPEQARGNDFWRVTVQDSGIGFEQKYAERIFNIFERLHGRDKYEGTGMGLATCRKIVERHHGTIEASGVLGKGSTFVITFPARQNRSEVFV
jgi:signal transduction histidine kinase